MGPGCSRLPAPTGPGAQNRCFFKGFLNSPGHWPIGVLDNQFMGCWFVPPIVPQWSPGPCKLIPQKWACLLFSIFWPSKKSSKNRPLKKSTFLAFFGIFGDLATVFSGFWVYFGGPRGSFFDFFGR